jgi:hypothetical protein
MKRQLCRREMLAQTGVALGTGVAASLTSMAAAAAPERAQNDPRPEPESFRYCFNTSTIRGQKLTLVEEIEIAAKAGYQAVEPWIKEIEDYRQTGGSLKDLDKRIRDLGLTVESAIGFAEWIVDDEARRAKGLEQARWDMDLVRQIGGKRLAAPPVGATEQADIDLLEAAERYRALLELGSQMGVAPQVELWGFSKTLSRLGQVAHDELDGRVETVGHGGVGGAGVDDRDLGSAGQEEVDHVRADEAGTPGHEGLIAGEGRGEAASAWPEIVAHRPS